MKFINTLVLTAAIGIAHATELEQLDGKSSTKTCRALAMSGGANNGAWENGVMWGLTHFGKEKDFRWDVVTGVSAGAINAAYMSAWAPRDTKEMTEQLKLAWESLTTHSIWKLWPNEIATAFLYSAIASFT